jgi:hypothetical protein
VKTERLDTHTSQGRRVAIWRSVPDAPSPDAPIIVLNAGFARRMRDVGSIALCLVRNGALVYRFDSVDHLGLSDGDILNFTFTGMTESLRAAIDLTRATENRRKVVLAALSLANLAAYQLAAEDSDIVRIMAISGVVNGLRTLKKVTGHDYSEVRYEDLPERVAVLGYQIDPRPLWTDHRKADCLSFDAAVGQLTRITAAVANCVAASDPWVDIDECEQAFTRGAGGDRMIIRLPYSGHDLGRNPVAITTILQRMTRLALGTGPLRYAESLPVELPRFDELLELRIAERNHEMSEQAAPVREGSTTG